MPYDVGGHWIAYVIDLFVSGLVGSKDLLSVSTWKGIPNERGPPARATESRTDPLPARSRAEAGGELPGWCAPGSVSSGGGAR